MLSVERGVFAARMRELETELAGGARPSHNKLPPAKARCEGRCTLEPCTMRRLGVLFRSIR